MNIFALLLTLLLVFSAYIVGCEGLRCHECSSADHTACEDPFDKDRAKAAGFLALCDEPTKQGQRVLCRKTHQTVLGNVRIIRSCGYANHSETCVGSRNAEVVVRSCQCFKKDGCNGATTMTIAGTVVVLAAALRAIY
ncbi:uncharacterized protein LOC122390286 [Amphibalanus amphitrite]|uniref:uncharacterized protein LOC122390286 n=1 Tax=Amphibalanus amphitrite TaxID=1232801 RepID=UPI001C917414|nr:uncharacterized protein LOC122390286 [Amphibalanus amphitrite]